MTHYLGSRAVGWALCLSVLGFVCQVPVRRATAAASPRPAPAALVKPAADKPRPDDDYYELFRLLADTLDQVERNYVKEVDRRRLVDAAIRGMIAELDPYSDYVSPEHFARFKAGVAMEFGGIGIQVGVENGQLRVLSPLVGSPAFRQGLRAGDTIVEIEGKSTHGITIDEAMRRLQGMEGTEVTLTIVRSDSTKRDTIKLRREIIHVETVLGDIRNPDDSWKWMSDDQRQIAYIRLTGFGKRTAGALREALEGLTKQNLRGLVLDLRFNPGGLLSAAIEVSDLFVAKGRIVSTAGRNTPTRTWDAAGKGSFLSFPMVVLVNRYSASASEIVAACLQDHHRAVIVGERTWGKGSVQNVVELEGGNSALKLTTAGYRRPNGKNIHRFKDSTEKDDWGVMPDDGYAVKLTPAEMGQLLALRREKDVVRQRPEPTVKEPNQPPAFVDPQLQKALEYLHKQLDAPKTEPAKPEPKPAPKPELKPESKSAPKPGDKSP